MVPVIDMQEIICPLEKDEETWMKKESLHDFGKKLLSALSSFGLVQLVSHGIPIVSFLLISKGQNEFMYEDIDLPNYQSPKINTYLKDFCTESFEFEYIHTYVLIYVCKQGLPCALKVIHCLSN